MYDLIKDGDIDLSPSFQRNLVWGPKTEVPSYRVDSVEDSPSGLFISHRMKRDCFQWLMVCNAFCDKGFHG